MNAGILVNSTRREIIYGVEPMVSEMTQEKIDKAIISFKNWKAPGSDKIPAEIIKYGGKRCNTIFLEYIRGVRKMNACQKDGMML